MPVETPHPDYSKNLDDWTICRDVTSGARAVKAAGRKYLPQLAGQDATEYEAYKLRAAFYDAAERAVKGCTGAIMRKAAKSEIPDELRTDWLPTAGIGDEDFGMVTKSVLDEVLTTGRAGILLDSAADADSEDALPYLAIYYAENIVNWRTAMIAGESSLILVVLRETYLAQDEKDPFAAKNKTRYRVLRLEDYDNEKAKYTQQVYVEQITLDANKGEITRWEPAGPAVAPTMRGGKSLKFIPFAFASPQNTNPAVDKSPILGLAEENLSHYRTSADLEHGRHFTALPMAYAAGFDIRGDTIKVGSSVALISADPGARAGYMEFSGAGLQSLERALDEKEKKMAQLGGALFETPPAQAETLGAVQLRQSGRRSVLVNLAISVSETLQRALKWAALWLGLPDDSIEFALSQEFDDVPMDPQRLSALLQAYLAGKISFETWYYNLQRGDVYPDDWTAADEKDAIDAQAPPPPAPAQPPGAPGRVRIPPAGNPPPATGNEGQQSQGGNGKPPPARPVPALRDRAGGEA